MKRKFQMALTWHNCLMYPPEESKNNDLYISDGVYVSGVEYDERIGWFDKTIGEYIPHQDLHTYWWADITQTVAVSEDFKIL